MPNEKKKKVYAVRLIARVQIPKIQPELVGEVHAAITEALAEYSGAEIELSLLPELVAK